MKPNRVNVLMFSVPYLVGVGLYIIMFTSCETPPEEPSCGCAGPPQITVVEEEATMIWDGEWFVRRDSEMLLDPCDGPYPDSLQIEGLKIIWSGGIVFECVGTSKGSLSTKFTEIKKL